MITHGMKIRRQLRSARASALSEEERRQELREAEARGARDHRDELPDPGHPPRARAPESATTPFGAEAARAGVTKHRNPAR